SPGRVGEAGEALRPGPRRAGADPLDLRDQRQRRGVLDPARPAAAEPGVRDGVPGPLAEEHADAAPDVVGDADAARAGLPGAAGGVRVLLPHRLRGPGVEE